VVNNSNIFFLMAQQPLLGPGPFFSSVIIFIETVRLLGRVIVRRKAATYTQGNTNRINAYTDIHTSSGIRTHDPSVQVSEDSSCLSPCGHCDRLAKPPVLFNNAIMSPYARNRLSSPTLGSVKTQPCLHFGTSLRRSGSRQNVTPEAFPPHAWTRLRSAS
jgi:hypothetical protein